ncbi:MAG TPA: hypothetical protein VFT87_01120 [Candidatus Saccharimonadales bacterium]|nr:hypothetical protein [Candidatus Saccharimonadales bacterium]
MSNFVRLKTLGYGGDFEQIIDLDKVTRLAGSVLYLNDGTQVQLSADGIKEFEALL